MIVIGDAAHATSPSSGQGASLAIEDAVELGRCLRDLPDVPMAFTAYEALRRERVERVVAHGNRSSTAKAAGPVGRVLRDAFLPLVLRRMERDGGALSWVHGHHIAWNQRCAPPQRAGSTATGSRCASWWFAVVRGGEDRPGPLVEVGLGEHAAARRARSRGRSASARSSDHGSPVLRAAASSHRRIDSISESWNSDHSYWPLW